MKQELTDIAEAGKNSQMLQIVDMLRSIQRSLESEVLAKQATIALRELEIKELRILLNEKDESLKERSNRLACADQVQEGNRQLINKLLGEIERLHQDIEWYRRTYEKRSLLGTIKEKLKKTR